MSFLAPAFLFGLAAIVLPVWLHRLKTQSSERKPFGSAMLLEPSEERVHVRKQLKYLPLLALRIGLITLIALAFAKPFIDDDALAAADLEAGSHLVVVDASASMQRDGSMDDARDLARRAIDGAPAGAVLQLLAAGDTLEALTRPSPEPASHRDALNEMTAGEARVDFGEMMAAIGDVAARLRPPVTLHVVSDFQQSAMPARFADLATASVAALVPYRVDPGDAPNARVESVQVRDGSVEVTASGAGRRSLVLHLNSELVAEREVPDGVQATLSFEGIEVVAGENTLKASLAGSDAFAPDDSRYQVFTRGGARPVPVITRDAAALPYTYLAAALDAGGDGGFSAEPTPLADLDPRILTRHRFAIVDDIGSIDPSLAPPLEAWVENGGALLAFAGERSAGRERLPITNHGVAPLKLRARDARALSVGRIDDRHPALATTDGWLAPRFTDVLPIALGSLDDVLVALENDAPLVVESRLGQGKVLLVAAGLENVNNDLPIRPVFVSFVLEAARYLSGTAGIVRNYAPGDRLRLSAAGGQVLDPGGDALLSLEGTAAAQSVRLGAPGIYTVLNPGLEYRVAVNSDKRESRFEAVSDAVLDQWAALAGPPDAPAAASGAAAAATPGGLELWPWALFALVLVVIGESLLGNWWLSPEVKARPERTAVKEATS